MDLITEYLALLIIIILTIFFYEKRSIPTPWISLYRWCLALPALSILMDIICDSLNGIAEVPYWLQISLNSFYLLLCAQTSAVMAMFLFHKILEHVYDKHCVTRAKVIVNVLTGIFVLFLLYNLHSGWLFRIDANGYYHRGRWLWAGYFVTLAQSVFVLICYFKNRSSVSKVVSRALKMTVAMAFFLVTVQMMFPDIMLNGILMAYADMIFFIHFQSQRNGYDTVTGLGNRKRFLDELSLRLNSAQEFQIVMLSLRNMDTINKKYGPKNGDELLYAISCALEDLGPDVSAFRFGSVTFAVLCPYWEEEQEKENLERITQIMGRRWQLRDFSTQVAFWYAELLHIDEDWHSADIAEFLEYMLWYMKTEKVKYMCFDKSVERRVRFRNDRIRLLRTAIDDKSFAVWYQPVYDLKSHTFGSAEALVRMWDENHCFISPAEFIPLAEDIGVIEEISWIVLEKVCQFLKIHRELPLKAVSVNMAMPQLLDEKLPDRVAELLDAYGVPREKLRLEMTERATLSDKDYVSGMMREMTERGMAFYLDDFGTGYSNFVSALQLPYECIKLDKSLMDGMYTNEKNCRIVRSVVEVFHDIGCQVIAEGIETEKQARITEELGIDRIQGFYFAKPMPEEEFVFFIKEQETESSGIQCAT